MAQPIHQARISQKAMTGLSPAVGLETSAAIPPSAENLQAGHVEASSVDPMTKAEGLNSSERR